SAEHGGTPRTPGKRTVQHVKQGREAEYPARGANSSGGEHHTTQHGAQRADGGDGVGIDPAPHHEVGHRLDHLQVAALYRLPESFHAPGRAGRSLARFPCSEDEYDRQAEPPVTHGASAGYTTGSDVAGQLSDPYRAHHTASGNPPLRRA